MDATGENRHRERMQRKKAVIDARIAEATMEKGLLLVLTGPGKGKSSSAFGMVARVLGHGMRVGVVQFIKGAQSTGEEAFFRRFPEVEYHVMGRVSPGRRKIGNATCAPRKGLGRRRAACVLSGADDDQLQVVAELVEVLGGEA